jgi:serine/threonine protein kinase
MDGYSLEPRPFYISDDNSVRLFKGFSLTRNRLPIVAKCHEFSLLRDKGQLSERLNAAINAGLAQARVEHPNSCKVLEICLDLSEAPNQYYVYHVLEALEKDLYQAVEQRKRRNSPYSEQEVWDFLKQTAGALSLAHEKVTAIQEIAHRDIKPENVFIDYHGEYKLGDFGCYFDKKYSTQAKTLAGTLTYMSPQQRRVYLGQARQYSAFKTDVFELGMTTLAMASLDLPVEPWPLDRVDQTAVEKVQPLAFSSALKDLLLGMLMEREENRPGMRAVLQTASSAGLIEAPQPYLEAEKPKKTGFRNTSLHPMQ